MDSEIDKRIEFATFTCDSVNCDLCRSLLQRIMAVDIGLQTGIVNVHSFATLGRSPECASRGVCELMNESS